MSLDQKQKKLLIAVAACVLFGSCGCCGFTLFIGAIGMQVTATNVAAADKLWNEGKKAQAIEKYRGLTVFAEKEDQPRIYGRLIDHELEEGNTSMAERLMAEATGKGITPETSHADAIGLLVDAKAKHEAKLAQQARTEARTTPKRAITLNAEKVVDLIDNPDKYAGKVLVLNAVWNGKESLREGGEGFYWPLEIGGEMVRREVSPRRILKVRIASADTEAEFKSIEDLPNVGSNDKVSIKIQFDGDFQNARLLTLKRR